MVKDIRAMHVQELINQLHEENFTYGTLQLLKSLLNEMFKVAIGNGYMIINPCDAIVMPFDGDQMAAPEFLRST